MGIFDGKSIGDRRVIEVFHGFSLRKTHGFWRSQNGSEIDRILPGGRWGHRVSLGLAVWHKDKSKGNDL